MSAIERAVAMDDDGFDLPSDYEELPRWKTAPTRFQQDLEGLSRSNFGRPITSYGRLVRRLGVASEPESVQHKAVQAWINEGHVITETLVLSLKAAGFHVF